jgi:hypothetical protein
MDRRELIKSAIFAGAGIGTGALAIPAAEVPDTPALAAVASDRNFNVRERGAAGDGKTDDTAAVQSCLNDAVKSRGGRVHFPAGNYRITKTLQIGSSDRLDITGDGSTSVLLHENDEPLLLWPKEHECTHCSVRHLSFTSTVNNKSRDTAVIACLGGAVRSLFSNLLFNCQGATMGSGIYVEKVMDTTTIDHCLMWGPIRGIGIRVAKGSEVRIFGGRIIGGFHKYDSVDSQSIGIHLTENNGGVHVVTTDLISLGTSMKIGDAGTQANREVFITHATFDSSVHGLVQVDSAYTSIAGCWSASSDEEQILLTETAAHAIMVITGGTIYNGGTYGRPGAHNGMVVKAGSFILNGVAVRENQGTGLLIESDAVRDYIVSACRFTNNGLGASLKGRNYSVTGNVFQNNKKHLEQTEAGNGIVANNAMG